MIKIIALGAWVCAVSLGSSFLVASMQSGAAPAEAAAEPTYFQGLDYRKTSDITVPMISDKGLEGYILARFVYTIDGKTVSELKVPPDPFVIDSAFRRIYSLDGFDFGQPQRFDLKALTTQVRDDVNAVYKTALVEEVLVDKFDYIRRNEVRGAEEQAAALQQK
ncbi:hypothetical protein [Antarcticirhabdus aurantiaca]|uniref:Uncharacterized protein n=1 Tax=Antarcticirhabdus aurantiaca TaxID=2606717 RepID=A0ACD4NTE4_9HYPH|nr:hypothetical protein [Antarcticirhabdus aurantiaca]WAJ29989.1 hypothetical protein OXU80_07200 [Jeongeuplla avenae]